MAGDSLHQMLHQVVVLDTATPIVYIGTLAELTGDAFVLLDADIHDCRDGHATREVYLSEARREGVTPNRRRAVVMRSAVISVSRLDDVVYE